MLLGKWHANTKGNVIHVNAKVKVAMCYYVPPLT